LAIAEKVNVVKYIQAHLKDLLPLPPFARDDVPLFRCANNKISTAQSGKLYGDLARKAIGEVLHVEAKTIFSKSFVPIGVNIRTELALWRYIHDLSKVLFLYLPQNGQLSEASALRATARYTEKD
jgi:hypothetical protein